MCRSCKIVNISWPLLCNSCDWSKCFNTKIPPLKVEFKYISFLNSLFVDLCTLCVKMKTFLCEESVLRHNNRNCFPSYLDHYLILLLLPVTEYACSVFRYSLPQHLRLMQRELFMTQLVALQECREFLTDNLLYSILCNPSHKLYNQLSLF